MASSVKSTEAIEFSSADKEAVNLQIDRLLSSSHFRNSRRYTDVLRFVVQQTLEGRADSLKERTLGIEVFGREPNFDTAGDSIVRVAAAEVRKRLAQYYQEEGHEHELRIDLPSGSYVPRFRHPTPALIAGTTQQAEAAAGIQDHPIQNHPILEPTRSAFKWKKLSAVAATVLILTAAGLFMLRYGRDTGMDRFWNPLLKPSTPVLICVGTVEPGHISSDFRHRFTAQMADTVNGAEDPPVSDTDFQVWPAVSWIDAVELTQLTKMLTAHNKKFVLNSSQNVTLADLRNGPVILLGVLENSWTLRLLSKLRFRPQMDVATQKMWIEDTQHPERRDWSSPWGVAYSESYEDYAVVTRCINPLSGQIAIEIGGLGLHASQAAGEFVTNPLYMNDLSNSLRDQNKNVQIVLKITVIHGEAGPPQVIAKYYW